jgi:hypothetical protein
MPANRGLSVMDIIIRKNEKAVGLIAAAQARGMIWNISWEVSIIFNSIKLIFLTM